MTEVELVIKIPKKIYKSICDKNALGCDISDIKNIIRNGTPLPKGHGRLKDIDKLPVNEIERTGYNYECGENECYSEEIVYLDDIISAETIIEADDKNKAKPAASYDNNEEEPEL